MQADYDELRGPEMRVELPRRVGPEWIERAFGGDLFVGVSLEEDRDGCYMMGVLLAT